MTLNPEIENLDNVSPGGTSDKVFRYEVSTVTNDYEEVIEAQGYKILNDGHLVFFNVLYTETVWVAVFNKDAWVYVKEIN